MGERGVCEALDIMEGDDRGERVAVVEGRGKVKGDVVVVEGRGKVKEVVMVGADLDRQVVSGWDCEGT